MDSRLKAERNRYFYLSLAAIVVVGVYLRLDQFLLQVLLDDEWHAVHQLLQKGPGELFLTIGQADFSIPLGLLYWLEKQWFGLSELGMRWPMMVAGLATLGVLPLYARRYVGDGVALLFAAVLAISPMLVFYSRMARPYALTLLLALVAVAAFQRFTEVDRWRWRPASVYVISAVLSGWLHLVSLPFLIAPFIVSGIPALAKRDWRAVLRMFWLGVATLAGLSVLVLPPLMAHPEALTVKLGSSAPTLATHYGVLHVWLGTHSTAVIVLGALLAAAGMANLWRCLPLSRPLLLGSILAYAAVRLAEPAWVHHPQTLARYLLPGLVLFLLAIAAGAGQLAALVQKRLVADRGLAFAALAGMIVLALAVTSPLPKSLAKPNSNTQHSVYRFDYRDEHNLIRIYQQAFPLSEFWSQLAQRPPDSLKVAAAPFSFETHHWDAARWERAARQRVMPGFLTGLCVDWRGGEVPQGQGFRFRNAGYLADREDLDRRGFDYVVYQKPATVVTNEGRKEFGADTAHCEAVLRDTYPAPVYEDGLVIVFPVG
jgi:hypothetical protein